MDKWVLAPSSRPQRSRLPILALIALIYPFLLCGYNLLPGEYRRKHFLFVFWNFLLITHYFKVRVELQTL